MNKFLILLLLVFLNSVSFGQMVYPYQDIKLEKSSDYSETEPLALSAATFILATPFVEVDANRAAALTFLSKWMTGTKAYQFFLRGKVSEISDDKNLLTLFLAAMAKYTLENKKEAANPMTVDRNASRLVLAYCDNPKNNFKLKKKYRKLLEGGQPG